VSNLVSRHVNYLLTLSTRPQRRSEVGKMLMKTTPWPESASELYRPTQRIEGVCLLLTVGAVQLPSAASSQDVSPVHPSCSSRPGSSWQA
jgi:hypothetical protein